MTPSAYAPTFQQLEAALDEAKNGLSPAKPDADIGSRRSLAAPPAHGTTVTAEDLRVRLVLAVISTPRWMSMRAVESVGQAVLQLLVAARAEARAQRAELPHRQSQPCLHRSCDSLWARSRDRPTETGAVQ
jgi:hypothetical protein